MTNNAKDYLVEGPLYPSFIHLWKDDLSMLSDVPLDWKEREVFRIFASKIYERLTQPQVIQKFVNDAYEDGYQEGKENVIEAVIIELTKLETGKSEDAVEILEQAINSLRII
jgi:uncharacterized protein YehS (DUF1456 family)